MAQDLRDLFKEELKKPSTTALPKGHEARFAKRMEKSLPNARLPELNNRRFYGLKIAAVLVVALLSVVIIYKNIDVSTAKQPQVTDTDKPATTGPLETKPVYLSDVSPEFKKVEDYYLANINAELAQLTVNPENKELIDSFMKQLSELDTEYQRLNAELDDTGINEQTVSTLINNLQLRLDLLFKLKDKLTEMKKSSLSTMQGEKI